MDKGDLVRIRSFEGMILGSDHIDYFDRVGVVIEIDRLLSIATIAIGASIDKFHLRDLQLIKRSLENKERLMKLSTIKYFPYQIFCDMDGVLVDFEGAASRSLSEALKAPPEGLESLCTAVERVYGVDIDLTEMKKNKTPRPKELKILIGKLFEWDRDWWRDLPFLPEGQKLWSVLSKIDPAPILLTSPMDHNGGRESEAGKKLWVQKNLNRLDTNRWENSMIFSHNKYEYAKHNGSKCVLIDDYPRKVNPFTEHGGIGILHKGNCDETLERLEEIINGH